MRLAKYYNRTRNYDFQGVSQQGVSEHKLRLPSADHVDSTAGAQESVQLHRHRMLVSRIG